MAALSGQKRSRSDARSQTKRARGRRCRTEARTAHGGQPGSPKHAGQPGWRHASGPAARRRAGRPRARGRPSRAEAPAPGLLPPERGGRLSARLRPSAATFALRFGRHSAFLPPAKAARSPSRAPRSAGRSAAAGRSASRSAPRRSAPPPTSPSGIPRAGPRAPRPRSPLAEGRARPPPSAGRSGPLGGGGREGARRGRERAVGGSHLGAQLRRRLLDAFLRHPVRGSAGPLANVGEPRGERTLGGGRVARGGSSESQRSSSTAPAPGPKCLGLPRWGIRRWRGFIPRRVTREGGTWRREGRRRRRREGGRDGGRRRTAVGRAGLENNVRSARTAGRPPAVTRRPRAEFRRRSVG